MTHLTQATNRFNPVSVTDELSIALKVRKKAAVF
jgi:hypothetical protein